MSQCWTVTHTGLEAGIAISDSPYDRPCVAVGAEYVHRYRPGPSMRSEPIMALLDKYDRPTLEGRRLMAASLTSGGQYTYLRAPYPDAKGVLLFVDTRHTYPCQTGGDWSVNDRRFLTTVAYVSEGHKPYAVLSSATSYADPMQEVDGTTCYKKGLLLLLPGGVLTVTFKAPGALVAEVAFDGTQPSFRIVTNDVDRDYKYEQRNRASESEYEFDSGHSHYSDVPFSEYV